MIIRSTGRTHLKNGYPCKTYIVKGHGPHEGVHGMWRAIGIILIPIHTRFVAWGVVTVHFGGPIAEDTLVFVQRQICTFLHTRLILSTTNEFCFALGFKILWNIRPAETNIKETVEG